MRDRFIKMHGLGNDFVVIDARDAPVVIDAARARAIADRRRGIGCDQIILLEPSRIADVRMVIWNADGSASAACGNAARCVATLLGPDASIETDAGVLAATHDARASPDTLPHAAPAARPDAARVGLVAPTFDWELIPLAMPMDTADMAVAWDGLDHPAVVNVGNPHIVFIVADAATLDALPLDRIGPVIEQDPLFPERINVGVAAVTGPQSLTLRVWERGAGLTLACGTGAAAAAVVALRRRLVASPVTVTLPGGPVVIDWPGDGPITLSGPATTVFEGVTDWTRFG